MADFILVVELGSLEALYNSYNDTSKAFMKKKFMRDIKPIFYDLVEDNIFPKNQKYSDEEILNALKNFFKTKKGVY